MMLYIPPPTIAAEIYVSDDCKNGSNDCFPQDTVGGATVSWRDLLHRQNLQVVSSLHQYC